MVEMFGAFADWTNELSEAICDYVNDIVIVIEDAVAVAIVIISVLITIPLYFPPFVYWYFFVWRKRNDDLQDNE
jgi:hypothetical protein